MTCAIKSKNGAQTLTDYCAGALDAAAAAAFETHVSECAECRRVVDAQREVWNALGQWTPPAVSNDFDARLYARIRQEETIPAWRRFARNLFSPPVPWAFWKPAVSLTAACAVLAVGFMVRVPERSDTVKARVIEKIDKVDIQQVEKALEDLDMLTPAGPAPASAM
jgi:anti-sigma-K factor RskA